MNEESWTTTISNVSFNNSVVDSIPDINEAETMSGPVPEPAQREAAAPFNFVARMKALDDEELETGIARYHANPYAATSHPEFGSAPLRPASCAAGWWCPLTNRNIAVAVDTVSAPDSGSTAVDGVCRHPVPLTGTGTVTCTRDDGPWNVMNDFTPYSLFQTDVTGHVNKD
jgi:hypothetical protein